MTHLVAKSGNSQGILGLFLPSYSQEGSVFSEHMVFTACGPGPLSSPMPSVPGWQHLSNPGVRLAAPCVSHTELHL